LRSIESSRILILRKQVKALAIEADDRYTTNSRNRISKKRWKHTVYRNLLTGHFTTSEGKETPKAMREPKEKKPREYYNVRDERGRFVKRMN